MFLAAFAAAAALASSASAHMIMQSPVPFNPAPDNSPLEASGSNFPCKKTGTAFTVNSVTNATVGQPVKLTFTGSATHNGGSCQISLTKDGAAAVSATSKFKVIYSILGGCPGVNGVGTDYSIPIPTDVPAGDYTWAWTWYNNIGNREIYMNCAPVTIAGGSGTDATFSALPDMAVYNLANVAGPDGAGCKTTETFDVTFPNPGKYVLTGASYKPGPPVCNGKAVTGAGGAAAAAPSGGAASAVSPQTSAAAAASSSGNSGGLIGAAPTQSANNGLYTPAVAASTKASAAATVSAASTSAAVPSVAAPPVAAPSPAAPSNGSAPAVPASPATSGATCSPDGAMVCSADGTQFALCNWGKALFMPVAAGTTCTNGAIAKRSFREMRFHA